MKHTKKLGLLAVAAAALMAFAGTASATTLTSPKGTKVEAGTIIKVENVGPVKLDGTITITCQKATGEAKVANAGGPTSTVQGFISFGTYSECGTSTVTVLDTGNGEVHKTKENTGTLTASEVEVTVLTHNILGTVHCIYQSEESVSVGTIAGSGHEGNTTATLTIESAPIGRAATDFGCGEDASLTAKAQATSPDHIYID